MTSPASASAPAAAPTPRPAPHRLAAALLAGWLAPGTGHLLLGRRGKGLLFAVLLNGLYFCGAAFASFGHIDTLNREVMAALQVFHGSGFIAGWLARDAFTGGVNHKLYEAGVLYASVASLLNFLALMDLVSPARGRPRPRTEAAAAETPATPAAVAETPAPPADN
ncbi:MAG: hypothetical protein HY719_12190 [Planctomycetes bacterium]|nr:hypothetical protein [Planctomycetota bacterium]